MARHFVRHRDSFTFTLLNTEILIVFQESDARSLLNTRTATCEDIASALHQSGQGTSRPVQEFWRGQYSDWLGLYVDNETLL
jgi:hypothetical protein